MIVTKLGAIDIGSNSIKCLLVNVVFKDGYTHYKKVSIVRLPIRLGEDVFTYGKVQKESKKRFIEGMRAFAHILNVHGVESARAVATSAMREAKNGDSIVRRVLRKTGIEIEIIDGEEEARLVFSSKIYDVIKASEDNFVYIDVGGGSTEISIIENRNVLISRSFNVGGVRLMNDLVDQKEWDDMEIWVKLHAARIKNKVAIGAGGNINKLHKLSRKPVEEPLTTTYLENQLEIISKLSLDERITELGLNFDRADVIIHALPIYLKAMKWAGTGKMYVPKIGVSDGLIRDMYHKEFKTVAEGSLINDVIDNNNHK
jgi:exopolyphosphatase/guanosine-5'-triphosphate,3'-diphosphate pyrophosphatase